ncbi:hypothetical protein L3Q82_016619 [Scortum barcoo]|uniref:Uncharacterized protein n=1 Tax=Scortum barcoo TaxID=214431 RepID=A0ACB8X8N9_9TELE|nr:hypothetical protein L3Q82_016619 [Scortum barcoo]
MNPMTQLYYKKATYSPYRDRIPLQIVRAEVELSAEERAYLTAVEKAYLRVTTLGVKHALREAEVYYNMDVNCLDPLGRSALLIAIENENLEIMELLLDHGIHTGDALLYAIRKEVVGAVELLLSHRRPSGEKQVPSLMMDSQFSEFTPDITPIMLAAHTNNYEIIKLLVQRKVTIPRPHQIRCDCVECVSSSEVDSLRHSRSRLNIYKALASPSLIALSSEDPILTAFRLGWELKELSKVENEFRQEYEELSQQCKRFAKDLLDQARSSRELETILNHRDNDQSEELDPRQCHDLAKLKLAIKYHQKEETVDEHCQDTYTDGRCAKDSAYTCLTRQSENRTHLWPQQGALTGYQNLVLTATLTLCGPSLSPLSPAAQTLHHPGQVHIIVPYLDVRGEIAPDLLQGRGHVCTELFEPGSGEQMMKSAADAAIDGGSAVESTRQVEERRQQQREDRKPERGGEVEEREQLRNSQRKGGFVAQPNCQQLLATLWYDGFPGWRRQHWAVKLVTCFIIGLLFPVFSLVRRGEGRNDRNKGGKRKNKWRNKRLILPQSKRSGAPVHLQHRLPWQRKSQSGTVHRAHDKIWLQHILPKVKETTHAPMLESSMLSKLNNKLHCIAFFLMVYDGITYLPAGSKERSGKLHQEALHQVHLSHGVLPDLPLPAAARLAAHRPHQPAHAGTPPTIVEWMILPWVLGFIWAEIKEMWDGGFTEYIHDWWNLMDFAMNSLYLATISLKIVAYVKYNSSRPREEWEMWHPTLIAEALFAIANIFSSLRLISLFTANSHLGPLQISLGRMLLDILKFLFIYCLVLLAFANGLNQLYFYYETKASEEHNNCKGIRCERQNNAFSTLFETLQSLFWSIFGLLNLYVTNVKARHEFTEFIGATMFGTYNIISLVVLLNMLIAMMNNSYQLIADHADIEWKFARTKLWMSYFDEGGTLPPPFNIIPSPKSIWYLLMWLHNKLCRRGRPHGEDTRKCENLREFTERHADSLIQNQHYQDVSNLKYAETFLWIYSYLVSSQKLDEVVIRNLVKRYVAAMIRSAKTDEGLTEENFKELKQDISSFRYEVLDLLGNRRPPRRHYSSSSETTRDDGAMASEDDSSESGDGCGGGGQKSKGVTFMTPLEENRGPEPTLGVSALVRSISGMTKLERGGEGEEGELEEGVGWGEEEEDEEEGNQRATG